MGRPKESTEKKFWKYVEVNFLKGCCWHWTGKKNGHGYGIITQDGKDLRAHRISYKLHFGQIPKGNLIRHDCDNPECCNPCHLTPGSQKDNMGDAAKRNRLPSGKRHHWGKISDAEVREIYRRRKNGETGADLAREFKISQQRVCDIFKRRDRKILRGAEI